MSKTIEITTETYERLGSLAKTFETPETVIDRLIAFYEACENKELTSSLSQLKPQISNAPAVKSFGKLDINFFPNDMHQFKALLLKEKQAWIKLHMKDGSKNIHQWNAYRFTERSDVLGNLRSGYLRGWREKGIIQADIAVNKNELI